ncbi:MAG: hypothetical protein AAGD01_19465 [Acidobacteriota bacterium]
MVSLRRLVLTFLLALSCVMQIPLSAQDSFASELIREDGTPDFLGADALVELLAQDRENISSFPGRLNPEKAAFDLAKALIERSQDKSDLDADGCLRRTMELHRELAYFQPPEAFEIPRRAGEQTPSDLASQAPEVLIVRVEEAESGYFGAELGTLVRFEVEEWIKEDAVRAGFGQPKYYFDSNVWITIGSTTYCQKRENVQRPIPGSRYLLIGYRYNLIEKFFWTGNIFPLDGGLVMPNSYPLMGSMLPTPLEDVRRHAE